MFKCHSLAVEILFNRDWCRIAATVFFHFGLNGTNESKDPRILVNVEARTALP